MSLHRHTVSLEEPLLRHVARWLTNHAPRAGEGDLTGFLVLLPSVRACATLQHTLLEESGRDASLLPAVTTPQRLEVDLATRLGLRERPVPLEGLRATLLAPRLKILPWVAEHPQAAGGLAEELVALFDEIRRYRLGPELLEDGGAAETAAGAACGTAAGSVDETVMTGQMDQQDLSRVREAWCQYREVVPYDATDRLLEVGAAMDSHGWPGPPCSSIVIAGFSRLDPATAVLLKGALAHREGHLFEPAAEDPLSRLYQASYASPADATSPLRPTRKVLAGLTAEVEKPGGEEALPGTDRENATATTYYERLRELEPLLKQLSEGRTVRLLACSDPEDESRNVAALVVAELESWNASAGAAASRPPRIAVACYERDDLARRVAAQLRDAGLDVDDSGGISLAQRPAGLLARLLLKTVTTEFHYEPLLELLTHPFVDLRPQQGDHARWSLRFEKMIRGQQRPISGMVGYRQRAGEWDGHARRSRRTQVGEMTAFVNKLEEALVPMTRVASQRATWREQLSALRQAWAAVAPDRPLDPESRHEDEAALAGLLARLEVDLASLTPAAEATFATSVVDFAAALNLLVNNLQVRPHRAPFLPVQITGLLEARLESYDLLILAGMSEDVFPGRVERPIFLSDAVRRQLGLPSWRDRMAERSELFLRLLHNGTRVVITWPTERLGQPCLQSSFVSRLGMSGHLGSSRAEAVPLYRTQSPPRDLIAAAQQRFDTESATIPVQPGSRPLRHLSHTALKTYRECPYRFLLESGYGLREEEEVLEEFRRQDYGTFVHESLRRFLEPGGEGQAALAAAEATRAQRVLEGAAAALFGEGADAMPQRRLWEETFREAVPGLVAFELERFAAGWRPVLLESGFAFTLGDLRDWLLVAAPEDGGAEGATAAGVDLLPELDSAAAAFALRGKIDRIDVREGSVNVAVIDYKTGRLPSVADVQEGRELQIVLYGLAVESGGVAGLDLGSSPRLDHGAYYRILRRECGFKLNKPHLPGGSVEGRSLLRRGAEEIIRTALAARDRSHPYALVPGHWAEPLPGRLPCANCPFQAVCRLEERRKPPHVAAKLTKELMGGR